VIHRDNEVSIILLSNQLMISPSSHSSRIVAGGDDSCSVATQGGKEGTARLMSFGLSINAVRSRYLGMHEGLLKETVDWLPYIISPVKVQFLNK